MVNKNPWIKYIILLVVAIVLLGVNVMKNKKYQQKNESIFNISIEDVTEISIQRDTLNVTLVKKDTNWVFTYPDTGEVNQLKVDSFLKEFFDNGE
jgi:heme/copper-type cytochrome/quinol oxidase subunit 2